MRPALLLSLVLLLPGSRPTWAESFSPAQRAEIVQILRDALRTDPTILGDAMVEMQRSEVQQKERAVAAALGRLSGRIYDPADAAEGNPHGDVTIVEFYDTRCPYCRRMLPVIADLIRQEPNVRIEMKDMPILGAASQMESRALLAAQRQGGYFKLRDALMVGNVSSSPASLRAMADQVGLDGARLVRDMDDPAIQSRLANNIALAREIGIQGTPAVIVGKTLLEGATDVAELRQAIAAARTRR